MLLVTAQYAPAVSARASCSTSIRAAGRQILSRNGEPALHTMRISSISLSKSIKRAASTLTSIPSSSNSNATSTQRGKGPRRPQDRELPLRKQFLFEQYRQVLSETPVVVFLKPGDFTVAEITKLRVDLSLINSSSSASGSASSPSAEEINDATQYRISSRPRLMFLRPGLLRPVFETIPQIPSSTVLKALQEEGGSITVLTMDSLHPPTLKAALAAVKKLSSSPNVRKLQAAAAAASASGAKGGKAASLAAKPAAGANAAEERIPVISAVIENRELDAAALKTIADLPSMDEILGQLVGLIELPARSVISMTSRAGGEDLVRALEGFKVGLEEQQQKPADGESSPSA